MDVDDEALFAQHLGGLSAEELQALADLDLGGGNDGAKSGDLGAALSPGGKKKTKKASKTKTSSAVKKRSNSSAKKSTMEEAGGGTSPAGGKGNLKTVTSTTRGTSGTTVKGKPVRSSSSSSSKPPVRQAAVPARLSTLDRTPPRKQSVPSEAPAEEDVIDAKFGSEVTAAVEEGSALPHLSDKESDEEDEDEIDAEDGEEDEEEADVTAFNANRPDDTLDSDDDEAIVDGTEEGALWRPRGLAAGTTTSTQGGRTRGGGGPTAPPPRSMMQLLIETLLPAASRVGAAAEELTEGLRSARMVELTHRALCDVDDIMCLEAVTHLYLQHNAIVDVSPLAALGNLTVIAVHHNAITTLRPLGGLAHVLLLDASHNRIEALDCAADIPGTALLDLRLNDNPCAPLYDGTADDEGYLPQYREEILSVCQALRFLDGVSVAVFSPDVAAEQPPRSVLDVLASDSMEAVDATMRAETLQTATDEQQNMQDTDNGLNRSHSSDGFQSDLNDDQPRDRLVAPDAGAASDATSGLQHGDTAAMSAEEEEAYLALRRRVGTLSAQSARDNDADLRQRHSAHAAALHVMDDWASAGESLGHLRRDAATRRTERRAKLNEASTAYTAAIDALTAEAKCDVGRFRRMAHPPQPTSTGHGGDEGTQ